MVQILQVKFESPIVPLDGVTTCVIFTIHSAYYKETLLFVWLCVNKSIKTSLEVLFKIVNSDGIIKKGNKTQGWNSKPFNTAWRLTWYISQRNKL